MKIIINNRHLLSCMLKVTGVIEKKQTMPILSNILFSFEKDLLNLTGTDMELEIQATSPVLYCDEGSFTLSARKLIDIVRLINDDADIILTISDDKGILQVDKSKFILSSLSAEKFPLIIPKASSYIFKVEESKLKNILKKTSFAMAHQDVRYYLNGLLLEESANLIRSVATDGHRLALSDCEMRAEAFESIQQVIVPRKTALELNRLLNYSDDDVSIEVSSNHIRFYLSGVTLTSKIIDGRYPDYHRVIPEVVPKVIYFDRLQLRNSLQRASVLSNEKYKGIRFVFERNSLTLIAHNPEHESAEEILDIDYQYEPISIGFNVLYLLDILNTIESDIVVFNLNDETASALIHSESDINTKYVIMPMRL
jgi:DNA polymerase III subunit beta